MFTSRFTSLVAVALTGLMSLASAEQSTPNIKHVLLLSVDGLHALDVARFIESHPNSALAELSRHGTTYTSARTPVHTDSSLACWLWLPVARLSAMGSFMTSAMIARSSIPQTQPARARLETSWCLTRALTCITRIMSRST